MNDIKRAFLLPTHLVYRENIVSLPKWTGGNPVSSKNFCGDDFSYGLFTHE
ncbi:MAG: hypothetical protein ACLFN4_02265 [Candidatus Acetothermia bacterium]